MMIMQCEFCNASQLVSMHGHSIDLLKNIPQGLRTALEQYDSHRMGLGYEGAQAQCMNSSRVSKYLLRLSYGLAMTSPHSIYMTARIADKYLSYKYIKQSGYFTCLMGLFYFNGSDLAVKAVLLKAWKNGKDWNKGMKLFSARETEK